MNHTNEFLCVSVEKRGRKRLGMNLWLLAQLHSQIKTASEIQHDIEYKERERERIFKLARILRASKSKAERKNSNREFNEKAKN